LHLSVVLRSADPAGLVRLAESVSTPGTTQFRHFLAPAEVQARFGPRPAQVASVTSWLIRHGLSVGKSSGDGLVLPVSGSAAAVTAALDTRFALFRQRSGRITFANTAAPSLPTDVAPSVASIVGLDDIAQAQPHVALAPQPPITKGQDSPATTTATTKADQTSPCSAAAKTASDDGAYTAGELADTYGFDAAYDDGDLGQGSTIALFELAGYSQANVRSFEKCYGITTSVTPVKVSGGAPISSGSIEVALDIDDVIGLAPRSTVLVYEAPNTNAGLVAEYGAIAQSDAAQVVSTSWGLCEPLSEGVTTAENTIFQVMALQGQSVVAASGDTGSADCLADNASTALAVDDPSSQPFVTGVGGTDLTAVGSSPTETTWNDPSGSGGGGVSSLWTMPTWQAGTGVGSYYSASLPCRGGVTLCREVPDVSASASPDNGYVVFCTAGHECPRSAAKGWFVVGGTSGAAPLWAALVALADSASLTRAGFLNPMLYQAATTAGAFNDVTTGTNDFENLNGGLYPATAGYDMATGLGSPGGSVLIFLVK
jgi:subtilase family serine protease